MSKVIHLTCFALEAKLNLKSFHLYMSTFSRHKFHSFYKILGVANFKWGETFKNKVNMEIKSF